MHPRAWPGKGRQKEMGCSAALLGAALASGEGLRVDYEVLEAETVSPTATTCAMPAVAFLDGRVQMLNNAAFTFVQGEGRHDSNLGVEKRRATSRPGVAERPVQ